MTSLPSRPAPRSFRERRLEQIAAELGEHADRVRERLSLADVVSLAIRAHRRQLRLSQRGYAAARGYSASHVARLERSAGDLRLAAVVDALRSTGFRLCVTPDEPGPSASTSATTDWPVSELVARDDAGRRLPAHRPAAIATTPHSWWFTRHGYFSGDGPLWTWRRMPGRGL
ncbi:MAG: hypothetical protein WAW82_01935 [Candidatus Lutibacillus vidarii]